MWKCRWLHDDPIVGYDIHEGLPLAGLHGAVAYYPTRFLRQFGLVQDVPAIPDMPERPWNSSSLWVRGNPVC